MKKIIFLITLCILLLSIKVKAQKQPKEYQSILNRFNTESNHIFGKAKSNTEYWYYDTVYFYNLQGINGMLIQQINNYGLVISKNGWIISNNIPVIFHENTFNYDQYYRQTGQSEGYLDLTSNTWSQRDRETVSYNSTGYINQYTNELFLNGNWEMNKKINFTYTIFGKIDSAITLLPYDNNTWAKYNSIKITYNSNNDILTYTDIYWNNDTITNYAEEIYSYTSNFKLISKCRKVFHDSIDLYDNNLIETTYYDNNKNDSLIITQTWDSAYWKNSTLVLITYNNPLNSVTIHTHYWNNNNWEKIQVDSNIYDNFENVTFRYVENLINNIWTPQTRYITNYNSNNQKTYYVNEYYQNNSWHNNIENIYTYNSDGLLTNEIWNHYVSDTVSNGTKKTHIYDAQNNRLNSLLETKSNGLWVNYSKVTYTYDSHGNSITGKYEEWSNNSWINEIGEKSNLTYLFGNYTDSTLSFYGVSHRYKATFKQFMNVGINDQTKSEITFYPNPSTDQLSFSNIPKNTTATILSIDGKQISTMPLNNQNSININTLSPGIYLVRLVNPEGISTQKFLKR
jgi:hypothetical protein